MSRTANNTPSTRRKSRRRDSDAEAEAAATAAAAEQEEETIAEETRQAALDAGVDPDPSPTHSNSDSHLSDSVDEEADRSDPPRGIQKHSHPEALGKRGRAVTVDCSSPDFTKRSRQNIALSRNDIVSIASLVSEVMERRAATAPLPSTITLAQSGQSSDSGSNGYFSNWNAMPTINSTPPSVSAPPNNYYSTASTWAGPLIPLPQQVVDDTATGKYVHISQYHRTTLARAVGGTYDSSNSSSTASSARRINTEHGKTIQCWDDISHAYIHGLIPASCAAPHSPQDRETDLLRFFTRLSHYNTQFGWQQALNYCESVRIVNMGRHPIQYRLCESSEYTQQLYITMLAQQRTFQLTPKMNSSSSAERGAGSTSSSRYPSNVCRLFNSGLCERGSNCRYKHWCLDCNKPNVKQGHNGCTPTSTMDITEARPAKHRITAGTPGGPTASTSDKL
jgi:acyl transferase domain-containing protein